MCSQAVYCPVLEMLRLAAARPTGSEVLPSQPVSKPEFARCKRGTARNGAENPPGHVAVTVEGVGYVVQQSEVGELVKCCRCDTTDLFSKQAQALEVVKTLEHGPVLSSDLVLGQEDEKTM